MVSLTKMLLNPDWTLLVSITQVITPFSGKDDDALKCLLELHLL